MNRYSMMILVLFALVGAQLAAEVPAPKAKVAPMTAGVSVGFGREAGQVAFVNPAVCKEPFGGPMPLGPQAFRISQGQVWLLDSVAGRLLRFDPAGRPATSLPVATGQVETLGDLALIGGSGGVDGAWVVNRLTQQIVRLAADGSKVATIGGLGEKPGEFLDVVRIETGRSGQLYVWDAGRKIVSIFSADGQWRRDVTGVGAGFCLTPDEELIVGIWTDEQPRLQLRFEAADGRQRVVSTDLESEVPPQLWLRSAAGELLIGCVDGQQPIGHWRLSRLTPDGKTIGVSSLRLPQHMNRGLVQDETGVLWVADGDYEQAPAGSLTIRRFDLGGQPEG